MAGFGFCGRAVRAGPPRRRPAPRRGGAPARMASGSHLSSEFFHLVKRVGENKTKEGEDRIMAREAKRLKQKLTDPQVLKGRGALKEFVIRLLYLEMLGHDASWGHMKAVELAASNNILSKKTGYLACSVLLSPSNVFRVMLVNQLQRDIASINFLEVCAALQAVANIVTEEMIEPLKPLVLRMLEHREVPVRKKAIGALHRMHMLAPDAAPGDVAVFRRALCDTSPTVMASSLPPLQHVIERCPSLFKDMVPSLVSIAKQIAERRLPRDYDYHHCPAPWLQMRILRILALLGKADKAASEGMYEVLNLILHKKFQDSVIAHAVAYECIKTITAVYPNRELLDGAAAMIGDLLESDSLNDRYAGIKALAAIVRDHPSYASPRHQVAVIDCLDSGDDTLRRNTLGLLCRMASTENVEAIGDILLDALRQEKDYYMRRDLATQFISVAERLAPEDTWYVETVIHILRICGDAVPPATAHDLLTILAEADGDGAAETRAVAADSFHAALAEAVAERRELPQALATSMAWCLGEYGLCASDAEPSHIVDDLLSYAMAHAGSRAVVVTALAKLTAQTGHCPPNVVAAVEDFALSAQADLAQRCRELSALLRNGELMVRVLPVDSSMEDLQVDEALSFLNPFVQDALSRTGRRYDPPAAEAPPVVEEKATLKLEHREPAASPATAARPRTPDQQSPPATAGAAESAEAPVEQLRVAPNVKRRWGRSSPPPQDAPRATVVLAPSPPRGPRPEEQAAPSPPAPQAPPEGESAAEGGAMEPPLTEQQAAARAIFGPRKRKVQISRGRTATAARVVQGAQEPPAAEAAAEGAAEAGAALDIFQEMEKAEKAQEAPRAAGEDAGGEGQSAPAAEPLLDLLSMDTGELLAPSTALAPVDLLTPMRAPDAPPDAAPQAPPDAPFDALQETSGGDPLLSDVAMDTAAFGTTWNDTKEEVQRSVKGAADAGRVEGAFKEMGIHHVQTLWYGGEIIGATAFGRIRATVLVHVQLMPQKDKTVIRARSAGEAAASAVADMLAEALQ